MDLVQGAQAFQILAAHLKETGDGGLLRELQKSIRDAAAPVARQIGNVDHLRDYMPDRYADVLAADLRVTTSARAGGLSPGVTVLARAPTTGRGGRKIRQRNTGVITHPLFSDKQRWFTQTAGMKPGFFDDPARDSAPQVRDAVLAAMRDTCDKITRRT